MSTGAEMQMGPPYAPTTAGVGGRPSVGVDVPICAVFLALFIGSAAGHMTVLQLNQRKGHKFLFSAFCFGYSMARIVTMTLRIVWATRLHNVRVAIASSIFTAAGVLILFLVSLIWAQRILRSAHRNFGWHRAISITFTVLYVLIGLMLVMVISGTVQSFYTLNTHTRHIDRALQLTASTYLVIVAFLPIPMVLLTLAIPRKTELDRFGTGRWRTKVSTLLFTSSLLCLGAGFRCGTVWMKPRPAADPAWYDAKWCYYFFNFTLEVIVIYTFLLMRFDRRFYIPNGAKGPGSYSAGAAADLAAEKGEERPESQGTLTRLERVSWEEEFFDDDTPVDRATFFDGDTPVDREPNKDIEFPAVLPHKT